MPVHNADITAVFTEIAELLEIQGENPFRVRAYLNAARSVGELGRSVQTMIAQGEDPKDIPGIGDDLDATIREISSTGTCALLQRLRGALPPAITAMTPDRDSWDAIVVGSGIGGLACAAALAKSGRAVLLVEQHHVAGGLTQTFSRDGFRWDVGVHYLGEMGPEGEAHAILDWLAGGAIAFASLGAVYDTVHFPGNFEVQFARPQVALQLELKKKFPTSPSDIDAFFAALIEAEHAGRALFAERAMPGLLANVHRLWHKRGIHKWWGRSSAEVLDELVSDPRLRAVLLAQKGNYGGTNATEISFGVQAMVMRHYFNGAFYPVGGAKVFAEALVQAIEQGGGALRLNAKVRNFMVEDRTVIGVRLEDETPLRAPRVFSDIGARNTVGLLPTDLRESDWAREILSFAPSVCHVALYLGLEGDIRACGATPSNHWFHETWDINGGVWRDPVEEPSAPALFVSFPSLKDPAHDPGDRQRHTAEMVAMVSWEPFALWSDSTLRNRPDDYRMIKATIEQNLLAQFARHFPALAPMVVVRELSTPLTTSAYIGAQQGAIYGLEVSPRRFLSNSLRTRTPIPGLFLTGQDVCTPGVTGAMMGGVLAAAGAVPGIYPHLQ
jgi:all-trans-retinol 13,14-reductase